MIRFLDNNYSSIDWNGIKSSMNNFLANGSWINSWQVNGFSPLFSKPCFFEHPAISKYIYEDCAESNANIGNYFTWKPFNEDFASWNSSRMCDIANGRNLMFVGDSLQQEFYFSFVSAALATTAIRTPLNSSLLNAKRQENVNTCNNLCEWSKNQNCERLLTIDCGDIAPPYSLIFSRSNFLDGFDTVATSKDTNRWLQLIKNFNISLLFLNTGAHHQSDENLLRNLNSSLKYLYHHYPSISTVYRNTYHGHNHCENSMTSLPLDSKLNDYDRLQDSLNSHPEYCWQYFNHQNLLVQTFLENEFPQVFYLDIASSTNLRSDSHVSERDCYHYCIPGPLDEWVIYHFNALLLLREFQHEIDDIPIQFITSSIHENSLILESNLSNGDIITSVNHPAHYIYENSFKRYVSKEDLHVFFIIKNSTEEFVKIMSHANLQIIPTKKWLVNNRK